MKPSKNSYYCVDCKRPKMLFTSKDKAERFMAYNSDEIFGETGHKPVRAYFCIACGDGILPLRKTEHKYILPWISISKRKQN